MRAFPKSVPHCYFLLSGPVIQRPEIINALLRKGYRLSSCFQSVGDMITRWSNAAYIIAWTSKGWGCGLIDSGDKNWQPDTSAMKMVTRVEDIPNYQ